LNGLKNRVIFDGTGLEDPENSYFDICRVKYLTHAAETSLDTLETDRQHMDLQVKKNRMKK
jgi:hypothetical protein